MINFYRRFLPNVAEVMAPLTKVLKGQPRKLIWDEQLELAFQAAKRLISQSALLAHPRDGATLQLVTCNCPIRASNFLFCLGGFLL